MARLAGVGRAYLRVVRSRRYFPLWLGQLVSNFGDTLHYIALVVLVFELTGRGVAVAGLVVAEVLPVILLGPVAGVIIDRFNRKSVLITSDLVRAALALSLAWPLGAWHAYLVAAGLAAAGIFFNPTVQAIIPSITTAEDRLAANSVSWTTGRLVQIVAASVAGALIAYLGTRAAFILNSASFAVSAILVASLAVAPHVGQLATRTSQGLRAHFVEAGEGLRFALHDRLVARLLIVQSLASFAVGATGAMLIVLAQRHLHLPPSGFAWLIAAIGGGALVGPLIPNLLAGDYRDSRWLFIPYIVRGVGDVLIAAFTALPIALTILFIYGLNTSAGMVVFNSTIQSSVPDAIRGRVFTLLDVSWSAMRLASLAVGGLLVDRVGIQPVFWGGGSLLAVAGLLGLVLFHGHDFRRPAATAGVA